MLQVRATGIAQLYCWWNLLVMAGAAAAATRATWKPGALAGATHLQPLTSIPYRLV